MVSVTQGEETGGKELLAIAWSKNFRQTICSIFDQLFIPSSPTWFQSGGGDVFRE